RDCELSAAFLTPVRAVTMNFLTLTRRRSLQLRGLTVALGASGHHAIFSASSITWITQHESPHRISCNVRRAAHVVASAATSPWRACSIKAAPLPWGKILRVTRRADPTICPALEGDHRTLYTFINAHPAHRGRKEDGCL